MAEFEALGLNKKYVMDALQYFHFTSPSRVQTTAIPSMLAGKSVLVQGKNGTGKTLAFTCTLLQLLDDSDYRTQTIILSPTREIAAQTFDFINEMTFTAPHPIYTSLSCGGYNLRDNIKGLISGCQIVIGTPGRVIDLIKKRKLEMSRVARVVLDEADALVTMMDLKEFSQWLPPGCQILAFSATYSPSARAMLMDLFADVEEIKADGDEIRLSNLHEYHIVCKESAKTASLLACLHTVTFHQAIVFYNAKTRGEQLAAELRNAGFPCLFVSGDMPQQQRIEAIRALRFLGIRVLLSTDLSSRGIDVLNVNLTVNMDLPVKKQIYVHRIGRAGRYGTAGVAVTMVTNEQISALRDYSDTQDFSEYHEIPLNELLPEEEIQLKSLESGLILPLSPQFEAPQVCALCAIDSQQHCHCSTCRSNYHTLVSYLQ
jgi:ATP-dependent RNA helicase